MTMESLLKIAEAAGFAMASDESEQTLRAALVAPVVWQAAPAPKEVLNFKRDHDQIGDAQSFRMRAPLASFFPAWYAKA